MFSHFRIFIFSYLLLAACSTDDLPAGGQSEALTPTPVVSFSISDGAATRGVPVDSVRDLADFRADAYLHRGGVSTSYFQNEKQYEQTDSGVFRCDNGYFWPHQAGDEMAFVALAPWSVASGLAITEQGDFTYTVPANARDQQDLLFAAASGVPCPAPVSTGIAMREPVPLTFRHLLTQVRFVFGPRSADFFRLLTVHSVAIEQVASTGTWHADTGTWGDIGPQTNTFRIEADSTAAGTGKRPYTTTETPMWQKEYTMFLLPQTLPQDARVAVDMSHIISKVGGSAVRRTFYIYLDGKQLLPGHTVNVEVNANYYNDIYLHNPDGTDVELRPLPAQGQDRTFSVASNIGQGSLTIALAPECAAYATISTDTHPTPTNGTSNLSNTFTLHTTDNTEAADRFIRIYIAEGHEGYIDPLRDHLFVLKQRGQNTGYGDFSDDPAHQDTMSPWGFNWTTPLRFTAHYDMPIFASLDYGVYENTTVKSWVTLNGGDIHYDYTTLRTLARTPNSRTDGRANTIAINNSCFFITPFGAMHFLDGSTSGGYTWRIGNEDTDLTHIENQYASYEPSAVMQAVDVNGAIGFGGTNNDKFVSSQNINYYLPAIEQLKTIALAPDTPLVPGRTYWSSTVAPDGEPVALQIGSDGNATEIQPGADTQAYVHPVRNTK